jgi:membrane-bound ClpP family serine protease
MKPIAIVGIILIVLGIIALGYQGISYVSHDKVIDMGPIQVSADRKHTIPIAPILGVVALIAGVLLVVAKGRNLN